MWYITLSTRSRGTSVTLTHVELDMCKTYANAISLQSYTMFYRYSVHYLLCTVLFPI